MSRPATCPKCGSDDPEVLGEACNIPEGISDRRIPFDELADEWHFQEEDSG